MAATENLPTLVLDVVKRGEDAALDTVRKCVDIIEETVGGEDERAVRKATGSILEMVDRLLTVPLRVHARHDSAGRREGTRDVVEGSRLLSAARPGRAHAVAGP